ncbi:MAG: hypothetical protein RLO01_16240 [Thalassobaculaceae bacterium]
MRLAFSEEAQKGFVRRAEAADSSKPYITLAADDWRLQLYTPNRICVLRVLTYLTKEPETISWMDGMPGDDRSVVGPSGDRHDDTGSSGLRLGISLFDPYQGRYRRA